MQFNAKRRKTFAVGDLSSVVGRETVYCGRQVEAGDQSGWVVPGATSTATPGTGRNIAGSHNQPPEALNP